jgi:hypothetical protein
MAVAPYVGIPTGATQLATWAQVFADPCHGLAMDIQRYLADEPVLAGPPGASYQLRKFARQHRKALLTAAAFVLLLILGAAVRTWQWLRAEHEAVISSQEGNEAETSFRQARNLTQAEASYKKAIEVQKMLADANPQVTRYQVDLAGSLRSLGDVLRGYPPAEIKPLRRCPV